jgi:hypothetical protein
MPGCTGTTSLSRINLHGAKSHDLRAEIRPLVASGVSINCERRRKASLECIQFLVRRGGIMVQFCALWPCVAVEHSAAHKILVRAFVRFAEARALLEQGQLNRAHSPQSMMGRRRRQQDPLIHMCVCPFSCVCGPPI